MVYRRNRKNFNSKGEISNLITKTDLEVDKLITNFLSEKFPEHNIVSEEQGNNKKNSDMLPRPNIIFRLIE